MERKKLLFVITKSNFGEKAWEAFARGCRYFATQGSKISYNLNSLCKRVRSTDKTADFLLLNEYA